jgi:hypothetical protein
MATAAALTVSTDNEYFNPKLSVLKSCVVTLDWTSTDLGVVSLGIVSTYNTAVTASGHHHPYVTGIKGRISAIETIPGLLGIPATDPPTNLYDITLLDAYGYDVADGNLGDRSSTVAQKLVFDTPVPVDGELTLTIAAAGNALHGRVIINIVE